MKFKWTPANKPPKRWGNYLITFELHGIKGNRLVAESHFERDGWQHEQNFKMNNKVIAWMELPKPYKGK